jgi:Na+-driven multidrug efflux pump
MGATGAGLGTSIATWVGTAYYIVQARAICHDNGFARGLPSREELRTMLRVATPSGVQQTFFAGGFTMLFWIIGQIGTTELGVANVLINVSLVAVLPGLGLGLAAASLVGQALGRGDASDAKRWGWDVAKVGAVGVGLIGLPLLLVPELVLAAFLHDPAEIAMGRLPLQIVGGTIGLDAVGLVLLNALVGAGDTRRAAAVSVGIQWFVFLPLAYAVGPVLGLGLLAVWSVQVGYRLVQGVVIALMWQQGRWASVEL